jgi:hypothetical protein
VRQVASETLGAAALEAAGAQPGAIAGLYGLRFTLTAVDVRGG